MIPAGVIQSFVFYHRKQESAPPGIWDRPHKDFVGFQAGTKCRSRTCCRGDDSIPLPKNYIFQTHLIFQVRRPARTAGRRRREWKNGWIIRQSSHRLFVWRNWHNSLKTMVLLSEKLRHTPFAWISAIFPERAEASFVLDSLFFSHQGERKKRNGNKLVEFTYGPGQSRKIMKTFKKESGEWVLKKTKYYILGNTEIEINETTGETRTLNYIAGKAILVQTATGENLYYLHKDYQGTTLAVTDDTTGNVVERYAYDPWGRRRDPGSWRNYTAAEIAQQTFLFARGYTGHEHLDDFGLINMNGRMYDPLLGRMLSPDNYVQAPDNSQNFNRYSYAMNNPLVYVDPDGEWIFMAIAIGAIANITYQSMSGNINNVGDFFLSAGVGALGGLAGAYAAGYACVSMGLAASGAASGAVWGATAGFTGGFISGAGNSWANGSNFADGLLDGLVAGGIGGFTGGLLGGIGGGLDAINNNRRFLSGSRMIPRRMEMLPVDLPGSTLEYSWRNVRPSYSNTSIEFGELEALNTITIDDLNNRFSKVMKGLEGLPYVNGGNGPSSYDCSGAVCHGIRVTANSNFGDYKAQDLYSKFTITSTTSSKGSLYFYDWNGNGKIQHVVTKISSTNIIHPSSTLGIIQNVPLFDAGSDGVRYLRSIDWYKILNIN